MKTDYWNRDTPVIGADYIFTNGDGMYYVGKFDGTKFIASFNGRVCVSNLKKAKKWHKVPDYTRGKK